MPKIKTDLTTKTDQTANLFKKITKVIKINTFFFLVLLQSTNVH